MIQLLSTLLLNAVSSAVHGLCSLNATFIYYALGTWMIAVSVYYALVEHKDKPSIGIFSGKFTRFLVNAKFAWCTQEAPALLFSAYYLLSYWSVMPLQNRIALGLYVAHYFNRTLIYPWQLHTSKPIYVVYWLMAIVFCLINGIQQGNGLAFVVKGATTWSDLSLSFWLGIALFVAGFIGNLSADQVMKKMREQRQTAATTAKAQDNDAPKAACDRKVYAVPQEGLYKYVVAANYSSETLEWFGYFLASGCSLNAFAFFLFTLITLWSRAIHKYREYAKKQPEAMKSKDGVQKRPFIPLIDFPALTGWDI